MRTILFALTVLLPATGLADDWTPPENPDPSAILQEIGTDTRRGNYKVALAKQLWFHENAVKLQPGQSGVRLSFALSSWLALGEVYPPALTKLREVRDKTEKTIRDENRVRVRFTDFHDVVALNRTLRQETRTADLFKWLVEADAEDAKRMYVVAEAALIKQKEYELCGQHIDTEKDTSRIQRGYTSGLKMAKRFGKQYQDFVEKDLVNKAAMLVAILVRNDRLPEAKQVAEDVKTTVKDSRLLAKLDKALDSAFTGTVPTPWP